MEPIILMISVVTYLITKFIVHIWISGLTIQEKLYLKYGKQYPKSILLTVAIHQLSMIVAMLTGLIIVINFLTK